MGVRAESCSRREPQEATQCSSERRHREALWLEVSQASRPASSPKKEKLLTGSSMGMTETSESSPLERLLVSWDTMSPSNEELHSMFRCTGWNSTCEISSECGSSSRSAWNRGIRTSVRNIRSMHVAASMLPAPPPSIARSVSFAACCTDSAASPPARRSHNRTVPSYELLANRFGSCPLATSPVIILPWPFISQIGTSSLAASYMCTVRDVDEAAKTVPGLFKASDVTNADSASKSSANSTTTEAPKTYLRHAM